MVVEAGGQEALEQLEGHDGCQAPDGVRRPKINRHAVPRMTLKSGMKKLPTGRPGNTFVRSGSAVLVLFQAVIQHASLTNTVLYSSSRQISYARTYCTSVMYSTVLFYIYNRMLFSNIKTFGKLCLWFVL